MSGQQETDYLQRLRAFGLGEEDVAAWRDTGLPGEAFDDWLTDRVARRPAGSRARQAYGAEDIHDFARRAILAALTLEPGDHPVALAWTGLVGSSGHGRS